MSEYVKAKSAAKIMFTKGESLSELIMDTAKKCSDLVGSTLGPGGLSVVIERQEDLPPLITKDGVTVFRSMGFQDSTKQVILESIRDASVRTADEAGDGPQPLWSKIYTPTGSVTMGEITPGIDIFGTKGTIQKVLDVFDKGEREIIEVILSKDRIVECCEDHLWTVTLQSGENVTITTKKMLEDFNKGDPKVSEYKYSVLTYPNRASLQKGVGALAKILDIRKTGKKTPMKCIKVSNSDQLYITDHFVATHNTSTATILAYSFVREVLGYCAKNPLVSPQKIVRLIRKAFQTHIEPTIKAQALRGDLYTPEGRELLKAVATISANGDVEMAEAVIACFEQIGDEGNVTLAEKGGPSGYLVEKIDGYTSFSGFEDSCRKFYSEFLNDDSGQRIVAEKPYVILFNGRIDSPEYLQRIFEQIIQTPDSSRTVVVVSHGFSDETIAWMGINCRTPRKPNQALNIVPMITPVTAYANGQSELLLDLQAMCGGEVFDPISNPLTTAHLQQLGGGGIQRVEQQKFRTQFIGEGDKVLIEERAEQLRKQAESPLASLLDKTLIEERIGKLTGGIAKLTIIGSSSGEIKEKKDRAEDAVCAVRGAIKHGMLPAGCWTLLKLANHFEKSEDPILATILPKTFREPYFRLLENVGLTKEESLEIASSIQTHKDAKDNPQVYDALNHTFANSVDAGLLDSLPAVLEAIRNSLSIATALGTCGGTVAFMRDGEIERQEAKRSANADDIYNRYVASRE